MNNNYQPKHTAFEAYSLIQKMAIDAKMTVLELAKANGCESGYELQKKVLSDMNKQDKGE